MKKWLRSEAIMVLLLLVPFIYLAFTWQNYPAQVPVHFNFAGKPDRYASKTFGLLLMPVLSIFIYLLLKYIPRIDPRKKNYALFEKKYAAIRLILQVFMTFLTFVIASAALNATTFHPKLVLYGVILLQLVIGNYISAVRPNFFVGIRTPWTLSDEEVWKKTHRFAGRLWVVSSVFMLLVCFLIKNMHPVFFYSYIAFIAVPPIVYSYILYQKRPKNSSLQP